jgi:DNA adenine methylase
MVDTKHACGQVPPHEAISVGFVHRSELGATVTTQTNSDLTEADSLLPLDVVGLATAKPRSAALRYPGSKWSIANTIVSHFGEHYHYVEPYFGSGAVFFTKDPSPHELLNDSNQLLVNFFRVLRDRTDELVWALETTPWSREEYNKSDVATGDDLEDARRFVVRIWQAHASDLAKKTGWKNRGVRQRARGMSVRWQRVPSELTQLAWRLQDAEIESRSALEVIKRFAAADALIYADPPYLPSTRTQTMYGQEMTEAEHVQMLELLVAHPGPVVLSGYDNDLYNTALHGWERVSVKPPKVEKQAVRMEMLWVKR